MADNQVLQQRAAVLLALHQPGNPVVLPTVWDAWSAKLAVDAGFSALTVGSHPVADSIRSSRRFAFDAHSGQQEHRTHRQQQEKTRSRIHMHECSPLFMESLSKLTRRRVEANLQRVIARLRPSGY